VQCSVVQCSVVQRSVVQCGVVQCGLVQCGVVQCSVASDTAAKLSQDQNRWGESQLYTRQDLLNSQWFQGSIFVVNIATTKLNRPMEQIIENHLKCIRRWEGRDGVTITSFSSTQCRKKDQIFIKRHHHRYLKESECD
jgi:hypothetical protein